MTFLLANWAVIALLIWTVYSIVNGILNHGVKREVHIGWSLFLGVIQLVFLLFGGFFTIFGWPQWVYVILNVIGLSVFIKGRGWYEEDISAYGRVFAYIVMWIIWFCGGVWFH